MKLRFSRSKDFHSCPTRKLNRENGIYAVLVKLKLPRIPLTYAIENHDQIALVERGEEIDNLQGQTLWAVPAPSQRVCS